MTLAAPEVIRSLEGLSDLPPCAITIGNFDGVHQAHQRIFRAVAASAKANSWLPAVLTFDPHPTKVVAPDRAPRLISTVEQRLAWMAEAGIERVYLLPFDRAFASIGPREFIQSIVLDRLNAKAVLVGENFHFGNRQLGDCTLLRQLGQELGFQVSLIGSISTHGRMISSTEVRRLVTSGQVSMACRLLGRPYTVEGWVVPGHGIGSRQTVPTLNLSTNAELLPANGVYITRTEELTAQGEPRAWASITNVGTRPTFDGDRLTVETFLLEPLSAPDPARIRLEFLRRLREERKFASPEALKAQILKDVSRAKTYHRRVHGLKLKLNSV